MEIAQEREPKMRKLVVLSVLALGLVGLTNGIAGADPTNAKNALLARKRATTGRASKS